VDHAPDAAREVQIDRLAIDRFRMDSRSLKKRQTISLQDTNLKLANVHLVGTALAAGKEPTLSVEGKFFLLGKRKVEQLNLTVAVRTTPGAVWGGTGSLPFSQLPFQVDIKKGSRLSEMPALQRINEKMKKWEKYYLVLAPLPESGEVQEDAKVNFLLTPDKLTTLNDFQLKLDSYEVKLGKNSDFILTDDTCLMDLTITGNAAVSQQILSNFRTSLTSKSSDLGGVLHDKIIGVFKQEGLLGPDDRLNIPMGLKGPLAKPEVEDRVTDILKDAMLSSLLSFGN
jgi:hypothetical protein